MRSFRFSICCILIFYIAFGLQNLIRPVLADGGGRFLVPPMPSGAGAITLDNTDAEWPSSAKFCPPSAACDFTPIAGGPTGIVRLMLKDSDDPLVDDELYVFIRVDDVTSDLVDPLTDNVILMFDLSHDHVVASTVSFDASDDRGIRFKRNNTVGRVFGNLNSPSDDNMPPAGLAARVVATSAGASWTVEARLIPSDLGLNHFNSLMGCALIASDITQNKKAKWPSAVVLTDPMTWANLIMRVPIDYALLIDQSGSMSGVKWDSARRAGDNFAVVLSKMKDPTLDDEFGPMGLALMGGGDRLGVANFTWGVGDDSSIVIPLASIPGMPPMMGFATSALPMSPGGWTPIAGGVNKTVQMFQTAGPLATIARTRVVMLLSDGQHNRPNPAINFAAIGGDFTYVPSPCGSNSLVRINPIGVGTDATVDPLTLNNIKNCFSGKAFTQMGSSDLNIYNIASPGEPQLTAQLTRFFVETLSPYYHWNLIPTAPFTLKAGERKLLLFAFWDTKTNAVPLTITKPDATVAAGTADTNLGISTLALDNPPAGQYTNFTATGASSKMILIDLLTEALFAIDNQPHGTGSTITLKGRLRDVGQAVIGADVRVDIARPEEGFGTYVSTHLSSNCNEAQPPQLPTTGTILQLVAGISRVKGPAVSRGGFIVAPGGILPSTTGVGGPDVPAPHFDLIQQLFKQCGKTELNRADDTGLKLFDDATHGDDTANDGIYTLSFENTRLEGSYIFRFRANGTTPNGTPFSRVREIGEYVRIDVDPRSTPFSSRDLQQTGTIVIREYDVTPRDRFGGYLGPGHADLVDFNATAGTFITPVIDYNNGIYSRVLRFDRATENPIVTGTVDGKPLSPRSFNGQQGFEFFPYIGGSFYQNSLRLDNGFALGARIGYRFLNQLALEFESGVTFSEFNAGPNIGRDAKLVQVLGNVRYDIEQWRVGNWTPYIIAGAGGVFSRGFGNNDSTFAFHGGFGSTLRLTNHVGLRADGRVFRFGNLNGAPPTTNFQINGGVVFRF
jgi:hypothetical protein